jgi:uncharacterized protein (UPF0210 family)
MNLRSLTGFFTLDSLDEPHLRALGDLVAAARATLPIQTARLALSAPPRLPLSDLMRWTRQVQAACQAQRIDYVSLGALAGDDALLDALADVLASTDAVFASAHIATRASINLAAIQRAARVMRQLAETTPQGFGNLRFAALANVPPHSPFFPAASHDGGAPAFAFATEGAALAVEAFQRAHTLDDARAHLVNAIEETSRAITRVADDLAARFGFRFVGIDFSFAPYPDAARSIGAAIERATGVHLGEHGTLFVTAFITDCIQRAHFPRTGFCGVMFPVLEDATLAARTPNLTLNDLLLYATVCGTGLDTVPLPGDTSVDALAAILLDLATLAVKLNKPLTARLMPIPHLRAGDETAFDFEYFARARVMDVRARAVKIFETDQRIGFVMRDE